MVVCFIPDQSTCAAEHNTSYLDQSSTSAELNYSEFTGNNKLGYFWVSMRRPLGGNFDPGLATKCAASEP